MSRNEEAAKHLRDGLSPAQIADKMAVSILTVMPYLYHHVGRGKIRRSDIVFSIDQKLRKQADDLAAAKTPEQIEQTARFLIKKKELSSKDMGVYLELRDPHVFRGDLYEYLVGIEATLHGHIEKVLRVKLGDERWWREGIPESIRAECAALRERDVEASEHPFCYTTFIQLQKIIDDRWALFSKTLPKSLTTDKINLISSISRLNRIRNWTMHPVRGSRFTEDDFTFVRRIYSCLLGAEWPTLSERELQ